MYSISAWFWSKTISDLPIDIIGAFCGSSVIFVMTGLGNSVASQLEEVKFSSLMALEEQGEILCFWPAPLLRYLIK